MFLPSHQILSQVTILINTYCLFLFHVCFKFEFFSFNSFVSYVDYFYSPSGVFMLLILLFSLLIILLIVTSQHVCPKGPFRSSSFKQLVLILFLLSVFLFLLSTSNLLISLILLELIRFLALANVVVRLVSYSGCDYLVLLLFSIFVIEGVVGISGLIRLVSYSGSDYVLGRSFSKC